MAGFPIENIIEAIIEIRKKIDAIELELKSMATANNNHKRRDLEITNDRQS